MVTPFLKNLRLHYPKAHIAILASPRVVPLLEGQGLVDEVIQVSVPWAQHLLRWKNTLHFIGGIFSVVLADCGLCALTWASPCVQIFEKISFSGLPESGGVSDMALHTASPY